MSSIEHRLTRARLEKALPQIRRTLDLFGDRRSRALYVRLMKYRTALALGLADAKRASCLLPSPTLDLYFPGDLLRPRYFRDFVDCGAYRGDTLWPLLRQFPHHGIRNYYAFEPDPDQFAFLERNIDTMRSLIGKASVYAIPKALSDQNGKIGFRARGNGLSRIDPRLRSRVQTVRLDDYLKGKPVSFLKIEAEGDEIAVLRGAEKSIQKWHPFLAVTVYHEAQDLWEIPAVIKDIAPGYRLILRHHAWDFSRTVCYGIRTRA
jgi:FkbM family methyltransferase